MLTLVVQLAMPFMLVLDVIQHGQPYSHCELPITTTHCHCVVEVVGDGLAPQGENFALFGFGCC